MTVPGRLLGYVSGWIADHAGWPAFFTITILAGLPAIAILFLIEIRDPNEREMDAPDPA
jgi:hypothetical protein